MKKIVIVLVVLMCSPYSNTQSKNCSTVILLQVLAHNTMLVFGT